MRLVFMGTPDFAVPSMEALSKEHEIVGVITAPDKPAGRGKKLRASAVKQKALELGLKVLQPTNLKEDSFNEELQSLNADLFVVVAFRMLPESVWAMPPKGTINLHGSLLPQYRGAAPINWAIINGEDKTGLTTFFIEKNIDTGEIIDKTELPIGPNETAGELHDRMMIAGAELLLKTVRNIENGNVESRPQDIDAETEIKKAPKIFREDCRINWSKSARDVHNHIRGLSPFPGAWTQLESESGNDSFKIFKSRLDDSTNSSPGTVLISDNTLKVAAADKWLLVEELQAPGKKRMKTGDFLRGFHTEGSVKFN
jgi:methionyl-tRNA formyltransferase